MINFQQTNSNYQINESQDWRYTSRRLNLDKLLNIKHRNYNSP